MQPADTTGPTDDASARLEWELATPGGLSRHAVRDRQDRPFLHVAHKQGALLVLALPGGGSPW